MRFSYHRGLTPIIGVVLALALIESAVVHIVAVAYWGWKVALALALFDGSLVIMLAGLLRSFRTMPIVLADGVLLMRTGKRLSVSIPVENVRSLRAHWSADDLMAPNVLNMALAAWPNVVIDLKQPVQRRRRAITTVAHCVDDPVGFRLALETAMRRDVSV
jgi:hypothetical protein